jgi:CheY-like chemotaxis protein
VVVSAKEKPFALMVDDDLMHIKIFESALKKFGVKVISTTNSKDFLTKLKELRPKLCFVDLNIETTGVGFSIITAVRNVLGNDPVLILVTSDSDRASIAHGMEIGANDYIIKPLDLDVLASKISRYVETIELQEAERKLIPVPNGGAAAVATIELDVSQIDEKGIKLVGPHLLSKGTVVQVGGEFIVEITGRDRPLLLTVTSTWVETGGGFGALGEFDTGDSDLLNRVRGWVTQ